MPALVILSILALVAGVLTLSNATMGVGLIGAACYLGILARLTQATAHRNQMMGTLMEVRDTVSVMLAQSGPRGAAAVQEIGGKLPPEV